jgi:hypothetical protein
MVRSGPCIYIAAGDEHLEGLEIGRSLSQMDIENSEEVSRTAKRCLTIENETTLALYLRRCRSPRPCQTNVE